MLAVISDLHFEEEASDHIAGSNGHKPLIFTRNLPVWPYQRFIAQLAAEARRNSAKRLDLVLAGDIFDIHRTALWFQGNPHPVRPYVASFNITPELEARVLHILQVMMQEPEIAATLETFRLLTGGRYWDGQIRDFPVPVTLHYIPGNHDRLANATPAIRRVISGALGLKTGAAPFPHALSFPGERALVRHGHEYDHYNFSKDYRHAAELPLHFPEAEYQESPFGDFITIDVASYLPYIFRQHHGDDHIVADPLLRTVYLRLLEFDDLRPQSAMLNFLLQMPETGVTEEAVWSAIEPVMYKMLDAVADVPFLHGWLRRLNLPWGFDVTDAIRAFLFIGPWRITRVPLGVARYLSNGVIRGHKREMGAAIFALRESTVRSGRHRFLIAGHTHDPRVELIAHDKYGERYYVDTGTWRNRIPARPDYRAFGRLKSLTYVVLYGPDEDPGRPPEMGKLASVDFWSGVTQRWLKSR